LPARDERDGIVFAAELAPSPPRPGQPFVLRLRLAAPAGRNVVAHEPGAPYLVGLAISVPTTDVVLAGPPRYPPARRMEGRWGSGVVNAYAGEAVVEVPLRLPSPSPGPPPRVRVRAVFQVCREQAAACERPQSVVLDAPWSPAPAP
jgi:hypothetical protein